MKAAGLAAADANDDPWWRDCAERAVVELARTGRVFEAFTLVDELGVTEPRDHHQWGALFARLSRALVVEPAGASPSSRPTAGGSMTRRWRGTEAWRRRPVSSDSPGLFDDGCRGLGDLTGPQLNADELTCTPGEPYSPTVPGHGDADG